jgi:hypothetical protein
LGLQIDLFPYGNSGVRIDVLSKRLGSVNEFLNAYLVVSLLWQREMSCGSCERGRRSEEVILSSKGLERAKIVE